MDETANAKDLTNTGMTIGSFLNWLLCTSVAMFQGSGKWVGLLQYLLFEVPGTLSSRSLSPQVTLSDKDLHDVKCTNKQFCTRQETSKCESNGASNCSLPCQALFASLSACHWYSTRLGLLEGYDGLLKVRQDSCKRGNGFDTSTNMWYFTSENSVLSFDCGLKNEEQSDIAKALILQPKPQVFPAVKPVFPNLTEDTQIVNFIGLRTWLLFDLLSCDGEWLLLPPEQWDGDEEYKKMKKLSWILQ